MSLHLQSLREIFEQYHCFYDIANDPPNTSPLSYQPEFGNTIVGPGEGAVNVDQGLIDIALKVTEQGADMADFWDIESLFSQYFDGHVSLPVVQDDFYDYILIAIPEVFVNGDYSIFTSFTFDENQRIQLRLVYGNNENPDEALQVVDVETIDGQSVHDFIIDLANNPAMRLPYQSVGGRVNALIQSNAVFVGLPVAGRPTDILPDTFEVTFVGGGSTTFVTGCFAPTFETWYNVQTVGQDLFLNFNREFAEAFVNQPGEQFDAYLRAVVAANAVNSRSGGIRRKKRSLREIWEEDGPKKPTSSKLQEYSNERSLQQEPIWEENDGISDAHDLDGDVVVIKVQAVQDSYEAFASLWRNAASFAVANGQTKLMFDLSGNGGGFVSTAYIMLFLLFPEVPIEWFENQWDINFNSPMQEYFETLIPLSNAIVDEFGDLPDEAFLDRINALTPEDLQIYEIIAEAMVELCNDADPTGEESLAQCAGVAEFQQSMTAFAESPSSAGYIDVMIALINNIFEYSPWSVVLEIVESGSNANITTDLFFAGRQTFLRGGVPSEKTVKFNLIDKDTLLEIKAFADSITQEIGNPFNEYIFVSDGTSASAAAIVPHTAVQLWRNRDRTDASRPVHLLSYGGTGVADDLMLSSIPANVQGVHLEDPIIGEASLSLLVSLLPTVLPGLATIVAEADEYSASVAIPPYFADTLPSMPVVSYYESGMEPGAVPMQFVRFYADYYIPQIFTGISFEDQSDLLELYTAAATFFNLSLGPATEPPTELPTEPNPDLEEKSPGDNSSSSVLFADAAVHIWGTVFVSMAAAVLCTDVW
uniref:Tail specific protease domain-containing protein n=1 Tax=Amphora coffeiformis TaxID=265554 RepID=A0A7S3LD33_9STRA